MTTLAIIIVSWNVRDLLRRCLQAVGASLESSGIASTVIVVDNASSDGTPDMVRAEFPQVRLLEPGDNLGFVAANNLALRALGFGDIAAGEQGTGSAEHASAAAPVPYVLLLNPDTEPLGDALPRLVGYLDAHPDAIAVGPRLRYADGSIQSSRRRFPTWKTFFWESTPLERLWPDNPWARLYHFAERSSDRVQRVDWLVGAALLVRGAAIVRAGLLDERFFMYSEELEWQARLHVAGYRLMGGNDATRLQRPFFRYPLAPIIYLPSAEIIHHEARSSEQVPALRHLHFQRSKLRFAAMWQSRRFAAVLRRFLQMCYLWELMLESTKYLLGHKRSLRRQRIQVYAVVLNRL